ncbi:NADPH-dependent FMN reductase [Macrococcus armenti]|uniref:NADPH-dependent FMN reductase n=1 Tax=Macrococcus armenti TaxID=2875764 RepID=UPI001CCE7EDC|nr:NADPH-dependent FMN reductase [Macrococcus armenti]UBH12968.1 NAD(P)H-dependent oxidoreductase [Macrococcus armenti]UBH15215.1 NAD(P)H-dependent oxidoreductase [Macrococcus armenti]UBH17574.1 NAD(P)H-dependent oxidoreductase [Macrococcus armenti]UBH22207.1 NAD(P)H-dependent oxidoreductase [Macrococcus armenti]
MTKKILVISGSDRQGSFNTQLSNLFVKSFGEKGYESALLDYNDVPLLSQNNEYPTVEAVINLRNTVKLYDAFVFVSPEYNGSYPARLKNLIDWLSRPESQEGTQEPTVINGKKATVASAANSTYGKFVRKNLNELLAYTRMNPMDHEGLGIRIPVEAWGTGDLVLDSEQQQNFDEFIASFISYIEE